MRNVSITSLLLLFILPLSTFGQSPFSVQKVGEKGSPILFIPGLGCSSDVWQETVSALSTDHTCYLLTLAGFGGITPVKNPSLDYWTDAIISYIKKENIQKPTIVGHSLGGILAMKIASKASDLLDRIVIVDALPCLPLLSDPNFKITPNKDCTPMIKELTAMPKEDFERSQMASMMYYTTEEAKKPTIVQWSVASDRETLAKLVCEISNTDLREEIKQIKVPALVLLESVFTYSKDNIRDQYQNLSLRDLRYANKGLHFIMYDDFDWYLTQLKSFIR